MGISEQYTNEIQEQLKYSATWLPNVRISLGDIGTFQSHRFIPQGNLSDFGISFETSEAGGEAEFQYNSRNAVSVVTKLAGQAPVVGSLLSQAEAGVTIKFTRENAVLFRATKCTTNRIKNINILGQTIMQKYDDDDWDQNLVIVTQVVPAEGSTIIISSASNSQIDLSAKGEVGAGNINLADANLGLTIIRESNIETKIVAQPKLTPLFEAWGLRRNPWKFGKKEFKPQRKKEEVMEFGKVDYNDFN